MSSQPLVSSSGCESRSGSARRLDESCVRNVGQRASCTYPCSKRSTCLPDTNGVRATSNRPRRFAPPADRIPTEQKGLRDIGPLACRNRVRRREAEVTPFAGVRATCGTSSCRTAVGHLTHSRLGPCRPPGPPASPARENSQRSEQPCRHRRSRRRRRRASHGSNLHAATRATEEGTGS